MKFINNTNKTNIKLYRNHLNSDCYFKHEDDESIYIFDAHSKAIIPLFKSDSYGKLELRSNIPISIINIDGVTINNQSISKLVGIFFTKNLVNEFEHKEINTDIKYNINNLNDYSLYIFEKEKGRILIFKAVNCIYHIYPDCPRVMSISCGFNMNHFEYVIENNITHVGYKEVSK